VVPYIQEAKFTVDRVLVCWDASRSATRAVGDALPFLTHAKAIDVVVVSTERFKSDELPGAGMAKHLSRRAANVELRRLVASDIDVANAILSYAADVSEHLCLTDYAASLVLPCATGPRPFIR
jgi:hypothetical protein